MVSRRDYTAEAVAACRSVLIEVIHLLGELREHAVVVGGWVPALLFPDASEPHAGTLDIDLALNFARIPEASYRTILEGLTDRGYRQDAANPFRFFREVPVAGRPPVTVEVDLLAGEYGGTGPGHRTQAVQDVRARKARGCDLAFPDPVQVSLEGELPGGGRDRVAFRVAGIVPWLVMKGMALADRLKAKDAYDITYCLRHVPGGAAALAGIFRPHLDRRLVREGLQKIRSQFRSVDHVGPRSVADFLEIVEPEERLIAQRQAFELVASFLDATEVDYLL